MAQVKVYKDGERIIASFDAMSKKERDKILSFIFELNSQNNFEEHKVPGLKPVNIDTGRRKKQNSLQTKARQTNTNDINNTQVQPANRYKDKQKATVNAEIMPVDDLKAALLNSSGSAKQTLNKIALSRNFFSIQQYLDFVGEIELRKTGKACFGL